MGTRALVKIKQNDEISINLFVSSDGYLSGLGGTLLDILKRKHVNGYSDSQKQYNRVGNFVALIVAKLVIQQTDSENRVREILNQPKLDDLACGGVEIIGCSEKENVDYIYEIKFECTLEKPQPPLIKVKSYDFESEWLNVSEFSNLIDNGIPDDEDD